MRLSDLPKIKSTAVSFSNNITGIMWLLTHISEASHIINDNKAVNEIGEGESFSKDLQNCMTWESKKCCIFLYISYIKEDVLFICIFVKGKGQSFSFYLQSCIKNIPILQWYWNIYTSLRPLIKMTVSSVQMYKLLVRSVNLLGYVHWWWRPYKNYWTGQLFLLK